MIMVLLTDEFMASTIVVVTQYYDRVIRFSSGNWDGNLKKELRL